MVYRCGQVRRLGIVPRLGSRLGVLESILGVALGIALGLGLRHAFLRLRQGRLETGVQGAAIHFSGRRTRVLGHRFRL